MDQAVKLRTYIVEDNATIRANLIDALEELACVEAVGVAATDVRMRCAQLGVDAVFDKSNEIDALVDYCIEHSSKASDCAPTPGPDAP